MFTSIRRSVAVVLCVLVAAPAVAQMNHNNSHTHDTHTMPGLHGENASAAESAEIAVLFRNFRSLTRSVENLPNGIRTITRSDDPEVMEVLVSHVAGMLDRVERGDDPKIRIQSPTLGIFFERPEALENTIEMSVAGIVVTQTSEDPEVVAALQTHAAEVTAMAERGMDAVHEMMMQRARN